MIPIKKELCLHMTSYLHFSLCTRQYASFTQNICQIHTSFVYFPRMHTYLLFATHTYWLHKERETHEQQTLKA